MQREKKKKKAGKEISPGSGVGMVKRLFNILVGAILYYLNFLW